MFYLEKKGLLPLLILLHSVMLPLFGVLIAILITEFSIPNLLIALFFVFFYLSILLAMLKETSTHKYYLTIKDGIFEIVYPRVKKGDKLIIASNEIIQLEYYKLFSLVGWLDAFGGGAMTKFVLITYINDDGEKVRRGMGYLDYKDILSIAKENHIRLVVHKFVTKKTFLNQDQ